MNKMTLSCMIRMKASMNQLKWKFHSKHFEEKKDFEILIKPKQHFGIIKK